MSPKQRPASGQPAGDSPVALAERVQARLVEASAAIELRSRARRAGGKRKSGAAPPTRSKETLALAAVFHELGDAHRQHRLHTGQRVSPALKQAAQEFKTAPSVATLVAVAAFLDEDGLLAW
jgi:hypothetical protein